MADFGIGEIAALVSALGAVAGAGTGVASAVSAANRPRPAAMPQVPQVDTSQMARALLPGAKADAAARSGGGLSPEFLANLVSQGTGDPSSGLDILGDIKRSLGPGQV